MLPNPQARSAAFSLEGSYGNWRKLIAKEIDPVQALMGGQFRFKGNMLKVMRYNRAARELVNTATLIPTEFV
ncbi:sterol carrier protein [mine drainage metagenome]|uniref:Sterol carrier protein n=2 Tax=mine drainage metagenome TaxID=410659 RepID=T1B5X7_9ZZZZ